MNLKVETRKLIRDIIYILIGLQILLGVVWAFGNIDEIPRFEESLELISMSETLARDEYTGILYLLCVRMAMLLGTFAGLPGCAFLYILQLVTAYLSYAYFLKKVMPNVGNKVWFFAGFVITLPTVLQDMMAVLPYGLASSLFIFLLAEVVQLWRRKTEKLSVGCILRVGVLWVLSALICPAYAWFGGIAVALSVGRHMMLHKCFSMKLCAMFLAAILCINVVNVVSDTEENTGKIQNTIGAAMLRRAVWPNFAGFRFFWSPEVTELFDNEQLLGISKYPEKVIYEFGPTMEAAYGRERANEIYWEMAETAFGLDTRRIIGNILKDMVAYMCPTLAVALQLHGVGESYAGWNYGRMKDYTPVLAEYYVDYTLLAWIVVLGLSIVWWILDRSRNRQPADATIEKGKYKKEWIGEFLLVIALFINVWYVMSSGNMQDYKKLIVNSVLCAFFVVKLLLSGNIDK